MLSQTLLLLAASSLAAAETVQLWIKSDSSEIDGNSIGFPHEGAGINYAFLGTGAITSSLEYDEEDSSLSYASGSLPQVFSVDSAYVAVTVTGSTHNFTFDDTTLLVDGSADGFYACKNTNDPYRYSEMSYELMYYTSDAPSDCLTLTLVNKQPSSSSSSSSSSSVAPTSSFSSSTGIPTDDGTSTSSGISTFTDAANGRYIPGAAVAFGLLAALV